MRILKSKTLATLIACCLLVFVFDAVTYSATGDSLLLGKVNKANKATTIERTTSGAVLSLDAKPGSPPLKVDSGKLVSKLNADRVDGRHATDMLNRVVILQDNDLTTVHSGVTTWNLGNVPAGRYLISYTAALDHSATPFEALCGVHGGSFQDITATGHMVNNSWIDTWLSGTGYRVVDPTTDRFFCQITSGTWTLKNPLRLVFTPIASVSTQAPSARVVPRPLAGAKD